MPRQRPTQLPCPLSQAPPPELSFEERLAACTRLAAWIQGASAAWGLGGGSTGAGSASAAAAAAAGAWAGPGGQQGTAQREAVYARMSRELARWLVCDSQEGRLGPSAEQVVLAAGLGSLTQRGTMVGLQMAAADLSLLLG